MSQKMRHCTLFSLCVIITWNKQPNNMIDGKNSIRRNHKRQDNKQNGKRHTIEEEENKKTAWCSKTLTFSCSCCFGFRPFLCVLSHRRLSRNQNKYPLFPQRFVRALALYAHIWMRDYQQIDGLGAFNCTHIHIGTKSKQPRAEAAK